MCGMDAMDDRAAVAWLHRRAGFGLALPDLEAAVSRGPAAEIDRLLAPDAVSAAVAADPWSNDDLPFERNKAQATKAITTWLAEMTATTTPAVDRMAWLWHGHFVSALDKVKVARFMVDQIRLFRSGGMGSFAALLRAVTIDPAMLIYLDGTTSTGTEPNENYGREVLELFTLGVGNYTEDDVKAGAKALTGWRLRPAVGTVDFVAKRHDDAAQSYLGQQGVHDLDSVVAAIMASPSLPTFIAGTVAAELLGTTDASVIAPLAATFASSNFDITTLVRATLQAGIAGQSQPIVLAPVPWLVMAQRVTAGSATAKVGLTALRTAGQVPMTPPNVAGWPGGAAWFGSSTVVARATLAAAVAAAAPADNAARAAADGDDLDALANALGLVTPTFDAASSAALSAATPGRERLALALCTPEFVLA
ncbi:MAG: hypothetical protein JWM34_3882 [Ilumatobacteraceae bacterium]|nr:hypothetical protein [Ilumatobacteraceae bacterium]